MNKNILFVVNSGIISSNENGGASVNYSHLELLFKAGFSVQLLVLEWNDQHQFYKDDYDEISSFVKNIETYKVVKSPFKRGVSRLKEAVFSPAKFEYNFLTKENFSFINLFVQEKNIDVVFCEWRWSALLATNAELDVPVIYSHHDWEFKLAKLRKKRNLLQKFHTFQKKRVEYKLVKSAHGCISGSITESNEISKISKKESLYIPTTYTNAESKLVPNLMPNIIHLGGMGTTANKIGLERFLDVCWTEIKRSHPEVKLIVVGSLKNASNTLLEKLEDANIDCLGFVKDLSTVLYPQDIHIIPWEYNTGTRTRLPLILNYEQVLVATKESVKAFPEIENDNNALLCNTLQEMRTKISNLIQDPQRIKVLSRAGKETFFNKFTVESQVEKIKTYIEKL